MQNGERSQNWQPAVKAVVADIRIAVAAIEAICQQWDKDATNAAQLETLTVATAAMTNEFFHRFGAIEKTYEVTEQVSILSHDGRSSLRYLRDACDRTVDDRDNNDGEFIGEMRSGLNRLTSVLNIAEALLFRDGLEARDFEVRTDVQNLIHAFSIHCGHGRRIGVEFANGLPDRIHCAADVALSALANFLDNAVRLTSEGGMVRVNVAYNASGNLQVSVTDNGCGFDPADKGKLFKYRSQLSAFQDQIQMGEGIGLFGVAENVTRIRGIYGAESAGQGQGARFWIAIPVTTAKAAPKRDFNPV